MPEIARATVDYTTAHAGTSQAQRTYASGSPNVFLNGFPVVRVGDPTYCGDVAFAGSGAVRANGIPIHRKGDAAGAHVGGLIICETGSGNANAG